MMSNCTICGVPTDLSLSDVIPDVLAAQLGEIPLIGSCGERECVEKQVGRIQGLDTLRFEGVGSPAEIKAKHEARIAEVRHHKNFKDQLAAERVRAVLGRQTIREMHALQRKAPPVKKFNNYRWSPESGS